MKSIATIFAATVLATSLAAGVPAHAADVCVQFSGATCPLSGDLGFFRFMTAKFPTNNKKAVSLNGRACGYGSATGTLVMNVDSSSTHLGATFICDSTPGVITAEFTPGQTGVGASTNSASASYGDYSLDTSCTATIVDCASKTL